MNIISISSLHIVLDYIVCVSTLIFVLFGWEVGRRLRKLNTFMLIMKGCDDDDVLKLTITGFMNLLILPYP